MIRSWERYKTILSTRDEVTKWLFSDWQNYGVVAGWRNLVVIDFDNADAFEIWYSYFTQYLLRVYEAMPYIVRTARGAHVYISCPTIAANEKRRGVDVKCHGYVVGPYSTHPTGAIYTPVTQYRLIDVFSLDTFLPVEMYPHVVNDAPRASCGQIGALSAGLDNLSKAKNSPTEYLSDPFAVASQAGSVDLITKIKSSVRIENLFANVQRTSADGRWYAALCPFHDDHKPSMWIDTRRQLCGCNTCGMKPMDSINIFSRMRNVSESEAITMMARELGIWG